MTDFSRVELLADSVVLEAHEFPLFEFRALYQQLRSAAQGMDYACISVALADIGDTDDEKLLNLVAASGYVEDDSDITFRVHHASGFFYTYFNFHAHEDTPQ